MSARAKVLFVIFSTVLITAVRGLQPVQSAPPSEATACAGTPTHMASAARPCETPWASCWGRATSAYR